MKPKVFQTLFWALSAMLVALHVGCGSKQPEKPTDAEDAASIEAKFYDLTTLDLEADTAQRESKKEDSLDLLDQFDQITPPNYPPVTILAGPILQWPSQTSAWLLVETAEQTPVVVQLDTATSKHYLVSQPHKGEFVFMGQKMGETKGYMHELKLEPLTPGESYKYSLINADGVGGTFQIPQKGKEFTLAIFGDTRTQNDKHQLVIDEMVKNPLLAAIHTGDMVDAGVELDQWYDFFNIEKELVANAFLFPVIGNHEGPFGLPLMENYFHTENNYFDEMTYYAFIGDVGLLVLSSENVNWDDQDAQQWIDSSLQKLAENTSFIIASMHRPMYTVSKHGPWDKGRKHIQPLLEKYSVKLVAAGHNHCYEHFLVNGVHYVTAGGGGAPLYSIDLDDASEDEKQFFVTGASEYSYLLVRVTPDSLDVSAINAEDGSFLDQFVIEK